jgi:hypothetical protein
MVCFLHLSKEQNFETDRDESTEVSQLYSFRFAFEFHSAAIVLSLQALISIFSDLIQPIGSLP